MRNGIYHMISITQNYPEGEKSKEKSLIIITIISFKWWTDTSLHFSSLYLMVNPKDDKKYVFLKIKLEIQELTILKLMLNPCS